jgi:Uma2 family endonuclease
VQPRVEVEWNVLATEARYRPNRDLEESFAMSTATSAVRRLRLGPRSAGMLLKPAEFDRARFLEGWRYELINGVLVVSPTPSRKERDPNEELGHWLRSYRENHPQGESLDVTLPEETLETGENRRRADRVIWAGLGRDPKGEEAPTIVVEFVSAGKVNQDRDYIAKRAEYRGIGVREYWVVDRFRRTLTVFIFSGESDQERVIPENQSYKTPLLPGFELPLGQLLTLADRWAKKRI